MGALVSRIYVTITEFIGWFFPNRYIHRRRIAHRRHVASQPIHKYSSSSESSVNTEYTSSSSDFCFTERSENREMKPKRHRRTPVIHKTYSEGSTSTCHSDESDGYVDLLFSRVRFSPPPQGNPDQERLLENEYADALQQYIEGDFKKPQKTPDSTPPRSSFSILEQNMRSRLMGRQYDIIQKLGPNLFGEKTNAVHVKMVVKDPDGVAHDIEKGGSLDFLPGTVDSEEDALTIKEYKELRRMVPIPPEAYWFEGAEPIQLSSGQTMYIVKNERAPGSSLPDCDGYQLNDQKSEEEEIPQLIDWGSDTSYTQNSENVSDGEHANKDVGNNSKPPTMVADFGTDVDSGCKTSEFFFTRSDEDRARLWRRPSEVGELVEHDSADKAPVQEDDILLTGKKIGAACHMHSNENMASLGNTDKGYPTDDEVPNDHTISVQGIGSNETLKQAASDSTKDPSEELEHGAFVGKYADVSPLVLQVHPKNSAQTSAAQNVVGVETISDAGDSSNMPAVVTKENLTGVTEVDDKEVSYPGIDQADCSSIGACEQDDSLDNPELFSTISLEGDSDDSSCQDDKEVDPNVAQKSVPGSPMFRSVSVQWTGEAEEVFITGSWVGWKEKIPLKRDEESLWSVDVVLGDDVAEIALKFIVDGIWLTSPDIPAVNDGKGNTNNVIMLLH